MLINSINCTDSDCDTNHIGIWSGINPRKIDSDQLENIYVVRVYTISTVVVRNIHLLM